MDAEEAEFPYLIPGPKGDTGAAGGGGGSATTIEVNLSSVATWRGRFVITDAAITSTKKILVWQATGPYTGKGTRQDEDEMQPVSIIATRPGAGSAVVVWETPPIVVVNRNTKMGFTAANAAKDGQGIVNGFIQRRGLVRGNVKFHYLVFS
jgi:hypothetical protein